MARVLSRVQKMQKSDTDEWRIEYEDGSERTTTVAGIAFYAREWDDEATVEPL